MRLARCLIALAVAASGCTAEQTLEGRISDATCGAVHDWDEHAPPRTERECTLECVQAGAAYVFISGNRTYSIQDQGDPALAAHAGSAVRMTGRVQGDTIAVATIESP